mmetsp:Transcript_1630/g.3573  ORF Transcript_1630/g.3573 Transcript_1630/m.3573 type:complete len:263 (+) Transcript_1630:440-1228(+)
MYKKAGRSTQQHDPARHLVRADKDILPSRPGDFSRYVPHRVVSGYRSLWHQRFSRGVWEAKWPHQWVLHDRLGLGPRLGQRRATAVQDKWLELRWDRPLHDRGSPEVLHQRSEALQPGRGNLQGLLGGAARQFASMDCNCELLARCDGCEIHEEIPQIGPSAEIHRKVQEIYASHEAKLAQGGQQLCLPDPVCDVPYHQGCGSCLNNRGLQTDPGIVLRKHRQLGRYAAEAEKPGQGLGLQGGLCHLLNRPGCVAAGAGRGR